MLCNVCDRESDDVEEASIRSNVRKFASEQFALWRCAHCRTIHARDEVDLDHYYRHYPFHKLDGTDVDWMMKAMYGQMLRRRER